MKRFTKKSVIGVYELEACFSCYPGENNEKCGLCNVMVEAINRLGEYEEAEGLEDED